MAFLAYCPYCEGKVSASPVLPQDQLMVALAKDDVVEVVHLTEGTGDHKWKLIKQEKENLRRAIANGLILLR
jgi:hypothetical protein